MSVATPTTTPSRLPVLLRALLALLVAAVVASVGNTVVSLLTQAAGASGDFRPLQPATYIGLTVVGLIAGLIGWLLIGRSAHPRRTMQRVVPVVVLLSWIPDLVLGVTQSQPHTSWTGVVGLMAMHLVVAAAAVATFARVLPLKPDRA